MRIYLTFLILGLIVLSCQDKMAAKDFEFKNIYDADLNVEKAIQAAISDANQNNKRVLLMFGANWCPWCQRLHHLMETHSEIKTLLNEHYNLVLVDLGKRDRNMDIDARYGQPNKLGIPVLVLLDKDGSILKTQETGTWEYDNESKKKGHDPEKITAFLKNWSL